MAERSLPGRAGRATVTLVAVLAPILFLASLFPLRLLLLDTTTAGGDMASHNYAAAWLRDLLLEEGRMTGWVPGNYTGFPLFQMYFPLPFVAMVLASTVVGLNVAFKLTTVSGVALLPVASWLLLRQLKVPFPGPLVAPGLMLLFLLQDGNTMWGGNVASTLAGEFTYSISLLIALLWFGVHRTVFASARGMVVGAIVVAALSLTHAYTVLWVALSAGLAVALQQGTSRALVRYGLVFLWGGALCAFWLAPLIGYAPWTTAFRHLWVMTSVNEVLPRALWPVFGIVLLTPLVMRWRGRDAWRSYVDSTALLYAGAAAALVAYGAAPNFGIVDVRFLPFLYLSLCLLAAAGLGHVVSRWPLPVLAIPIVLGTAMLLVDGEASRMAGWARWNYEGFESKPQWPVYRSIIDELRGDIDDARVVFEHSADHEVLGTTRAFENLPLFTGRSTLEGVNMQASVTPPFVFYIQSEISEVMSCPFSEWGCSRPDLGRSLDHLRLFHVSDVILRSDTMKAAALSEPGLRHRATFGTYEIYSLTDPSPGYVEALDRQPVVIVTSSWKTDAYRWFKSARAGDPVPLFVRDTVQAPAAHVAAVVRGLPHEWPVVPVDASAPLDITFEAERIVVEGARPGVPLLIKVSYHPRWRSRGGEPVWLAGPGFMLVYPESSRLELEYGTTSLVTGSRALSLGALLLLVSVWWAGRTVQSREEPANVTTWWDRPRRGLAAAGLAGAVALLTVAGLQARRLDADAIYRAGQVQLDDGQAEAAVAAFQRARQLAPLSNTAIHATYFEAIALYRSERWADARDVFARLAAEFPEAQAAAESVYHVGLCSVRLGETGRAREAFRRVADGFPGTYWAGVAVEQLGEL